MMTDALNCYLESGGTDFQIAGKYNWSTGVIYSWNTHFQIRELERFLFKCNLPDKSGFLTATLIGEVVKGKG